MKTIIAAVDFSNATPSVVENAVSLAKAFCAGLQLFHSVEPEPGCATYGFPMAEFPSMAALHVETGGRETRLLADVPDAASHMSTWTLFHELITQIRWLVDPTIPVEQSERVRPLTQYGK